MTDHPITLKRGNYIVATTDPFYLPTGCDEFDTLIGLDGTRLLVVHYPEGDYDTVGPSSRPELLHRALFDLYQTDDTFKDGDTFSLDGRIVARCEGVVVRWLGKVSS